MNKKLTMNKKLMMNKKLLGIVLFVGSFFLLFTRDSFARTLPRALGPTNTTSSGQTNNPNRIKTVVKFRTDRLAINITFTNLSVASSISYTLTYNTNGVTQGAGGSIALPTTEPVIRELLFGSCSHGVCRYDTNISNAKLVVTTVLKSGVKVIKTFKLKV